MSRVAVVGAGLSGLASAFYLQRAGAEVILLDAGTEPGGMLSSRKMQTDAGRWVLDLGPNSFGEKSADLMTLARACGAAADLVPASEKAGGTRFLYRDGKVVPVPAGPAFLFSPILPWRDRLRLLQEPFIKPLPADAPEETLAEFCDRRLGHMARLKLLTPVVGGIYAGNPEKLGAESAFPTMVELERRYGSLVRSVFKGGGPPARGRLQTFNEGLQQLAERLVQPLGEGYHPGRRVCSIEPTGNGWRVATRQGEQHEVKDLVLATSATDAAGLLEGIDPAMAAELAAIRYAPMAVVHIGVQREQVGKLPDGFGFLVPRDEGLRILGAIFSSKLFKGRAPAGHELLTVFTGGDLDPGAVELDDESIVEFVREDLHAALGGDWQPALSCVTRWLLAIPQYEVGHKDRLWRIEQRAQQHRGLSLLGNWRGGVAMPDCAREGKRTAAAIMARHAPS